MGTTNFDTLVAGVSVTAPLLVATTSLSAPLIAGGVQEPQEVASVDGAIGIKAGTVWITKASAAALTLAAPTAGTDDNKRLEIISTTAQAHTVTIAGGVAGAGAAADVATFGAAVNNRITLKAYNGAWYSSGGAAVGVTLG